jgi:membrane protease YdiL (CAAX protease family)
MPNVISLIFRNSANQLRNAWWVASFFALLALPLGLLILLSTTYGFEIEIWHQVLLIVSVSLLCQALRRRPLLEFIGKLDASWVKQLLWGLIIGALLMALPALFLTLFGLVQWQLTSIQLTALVPGIVVMISVVLAEEFLFRGFIFQRLLDGFGTWPAQLIIAGLFLLTHLNNPEMTGTVRTLASVNIFLASLLFGIAYIKTRNLGMPIGIHFMANITQGTLFGFGVSGEKEVSLLTPSFATDADWLTGGAFGLEGSLVGLITLTLTTILLYVREPNPR